jgi:asparagine synthase (glutamine-hydrolysing)
MTKVDRASMMHSLEVRAPFLDIELVDFVRRIPWQYKFRGGQTKYLLKKALEPILPNDILYRAKKGFGVPIGAWFKSGAVTLPDAIPGLGSHCVADRLEAHRSGASDERAFLWGALTVAGFTKKMETV